MALGTRRPQSARRRRTPTTSTFRVTSDIKTYSTTLWNELTINTTPFGKGTYSKVYAGTHPQFGAVAIKICIVDELHFHDDTLQLSYDDSGSDLWTKGNDTRAYYKHGSYGCSFGELREVYVYRSVRHPYIAFTHSVTFHPKTNRLIMIMQRYRENLWTYLTKRHAVGPARPNSKRGPALSTRQKQVMCHAVLSRILAALKALHRQHIMHRDLRPANILLEREPGVSPRWSEMPTRWILTDFGLSRYVFDKGDMTGSMCTRLFRAPELDLKQYDEVSDVYSLGCVGTMILTGEVPPSTEDLFENEDKATGELLPATGTAQKWSQALCDVDQPVCTPLLRDLLQTMLAEDPAKRPSAEQALAHPYFQVPIGDQTSMADFYSMDRGRGESLAAHGRTTPSPPPLTTPSDYQTITNAYTASAEHLPASISVKVANNEQQWATFLYRYDCESHAEDGEDDGDETESVASAASSYTSEPAGRKRKWRRRLKKCIRASLDPSTRRTSQTPDQIESSVVLWFRIIRKEILACITVFGKKIEMQTCAQRRALRMFDRAAIELAYRHWLCHTLRLSPAHAESTLDARGRLWLLGATVLWTHSKLFMSPHVNLHDIIEFFPIDPCDHETFQPNAMTRIVRTRRRHLQLAHAVVLLERQMLHAIHFHMSPPTPKSLHRRHTAPSYGRDEATAL